MIEVRRCTCMCQGGYVHIRAGPCVLYMQTVHEF